ncbi:MAG: hypothetical protein RL417_1901, partial [Pseudomonadota bacterium]
YDTVIGWLHQAKIYSVVGGVIAAIIGFFVYRRRRRAEDISLDQESEPIREVHPGT